MTKAEKTAERWRILVITALAACIFALDILTPKGVSDEILYVGPILLALWSSHRQFIILTATGVSALTILGFYFSPPGGLLETAITNRTLSLIGIWVAASLAFRYQRVTQEREEALAQVKTLRGLLPICSSCKKIRDDRGYWSQIETYIGTHSDAEFTHGICPECAKKLYPVYFEQER